MIKGAGLWEDQEPDRGMPDAAVLWGWGQGSGFREPEALPQSSEGSGMCYLAVDELGYSGDDVARSLRISGRGVSDCRERGKKILYKPEITGEYPA